MELLAILKRLWGLLLLPPTLLGIYYFPADLNESLSDEVSQPWRRAFAMLERETLLWAVCLGLVGWVIWTQIRPYARAFMEKRGPIGIEPNLYCESEIIEGSSAYRVRVYLVVTNIARNRVTLRNVVANFRSFGPPIPLYLRQSPHRRADLRNGEQILFEVGSVIFDHIVGLPVPHGQELSESEAAEASHNLPRRFLCFHISRLENHGIVNPPNVTLSDFPFYITISADDVSSTFVKVDMNLQNLPDSQAAFRVSVEPREMDVRYYRRKNREATAGFHP